MNENAIPSVEVIEEIICIYDDNYPTTDLDKRILYDIANLIQKKIFKKRIVEYEREKKLEEQRNRNIELYKEMCNSDEFKNGTDKEKLDMINKFSAGYYK